MFDESEPESNSSLSDAAAESSEQEPRGTGAEGDADAASPQVMNGPATIAADNAATPKRISQKKIEANQRNGRLSPGPRTAQGKKVASRNAVKWGLTTNFLITQGPRREDPQEFEQILAEFRDFYQPVGLLEDVNVQELAMSYVRTGRAIRAERGEISRGCEDCIKKYPLTTLDENLLAMESRDSLLTSRKGLEFLLQRAQLARQGVHEFGAIDPELRRHLSRGRRWSATDRDSLLRQLDNEITELEERMEAVETSVEYRLDLELDASAIPGRSALDRILRYENSNVRNRQRIERSLAELQAQRRARQCAAPQASKKGGRSD